MITVEEIIEIVSGERNVARAMALIEKKLIAVFLSRENIEKNFPEIIAYTDKRKYASSYMCHFSSEESVVNMCLASNDRCTQCVFRFTDFKSVLKSILLTRDIISCSSKMSLVMNWYVSLKILETTVNLMKEMETNAEPYEKLAYKNIKGQDLSYGITRKINSFSEISSKEIKTYATLYVLNTMIDGGSIVETNLVENLTEKGFWEMCDFFLQAM